MHTIRLACLWVIVLLAVTGAERSANADGTMVPVDAYKLASSYVLKARYDEAEAVFDSLMAEHPGEPSCPLMLAAVLQYRAIDYEDLSRDDDIERLLTRAESLARLRIRDDGDDLWARYFFYSAKSLKAVISVNSGNFVRGIAQGISGSRGMQWIIGEDPEFYDAYLMIGSYRFWKSVAVHPVSWLPLIGDDRERGIDEVAKAVGRGRLNGPLSGTVLMEMLLAHNCNRAVELGERLMEDHPSCRLFAWQLGEAYKRCGRWEDASHILTRLASDMAGDPADDGSGPLRCWWKLAVLAEELGREEDMIACCEKILDAADQNSLLRLRQKKRIEGARRLMESVQND